MPVEHKVKTAYTLPTATNVPPEELLSYFWMIFGRKNIGKSSFASSFPDSLNFQFERGRRNLPILMLPKKGDAPLSYVSTRGFIKSLCKSSHQSAVIDTVDALYDLIYAHVCESNGVTKPSDSSNGPELWNEIKYTLDEIVAEVQDAGKTLIFISHEKKKEHANADGTTLERVEPSCSGQTIGVVQRYCDFVFHYDYVCNDRVLVIRNTDNTVWTSCGRNDLFLDPDGEEISRIKIPNDPTAGYRTLLKAYQGKLRDYDYEPPKPEKKKPVVKK